MFFRWRTAIPSFLIFVAIFCVVYSFISYYASAKIALSLARAQEIQKSDNPDLWNIVENLSITAGLPMPKLYITPEMQINAFATGRDPQHAAVAVTQGALQRLNKTELQGVLAHELSHVGNRDILVSTVAAILAGIIALIADIFLRSFFLGGFGGGRGRNNDASAGIFSYCHRPLDPRPDRHDAYPACDLAAARGPGGRLGRVAYALSGRPYFGAAEDSSRHTFRWRPQRFHGAYVA